MQIFCDFDGTITQQDTTQLVLSYLADPAWLDIERQWEDGVIGAAECMQLQIALIRASIDTLNGVLDEVKIDDGFMSLVDFCAANAVPLTVVSDGVDYFIHRVLSAYGFADIAIRANHLEFTKDGGYFLTSPYLLHDCLSRAGTCKCGIVAARSENAIYIGDGRSDFCVAGRNLTVFAKSRLKDHCKNNQIDFLPFSTLSDIIPRLRDMLVRLPAVHAA